MERACAVCGLLTAAKDLQPLDRSSAVLNILVNPNADLTRQERHIATEPLKQIPGPVLLPACNEICSRCNTDVQKGKMPNNALANGLWVGEVPEQLKDLTWTERMMISRVKHNHCVVRVATSKMFEMRANAV